MNRKKLLIVDDSRIVLRALSMRLHTEGFQTFTAVDGGEAISTVRREKLDLILLYISFPPDVAHGGGVPWDGFLIMDWLRRMDEGKGIPVIIITGADTAKYEEKCLQAGAFAVLHKPVDNDQLLAAIHEALGQTVAQA